MGLHFNEPCKNLSFEGEDERMATFSHWDASRPCMPPLNTHTHPLLLIYDFLMDKIVSLSVQMCFDRVYKLHICKCACVVCIKQLTPLIYQQNLNAQSKKCTFRHLEKSVLNIKSKWRTSVSPMVINMLNPAIFSKLINSDITVRHFRWCSFQGQPCASEGWVLQIKCCTFESKLVEHYQSTLHEGIQNFLCNYKSCESLLDTKRQQRM